MPPPDPRALGGRSVFRSSWKKARAAFEARHTTAGFSEYRDDPVAFCEDILGQPLWGAEHSPTGADGQIEVATALAEHDHVALGGCRGSTKTHLVARLCLWFVMTRPNSAFITTAFRWPQVEGLWRQIRDSYRRSKTKLPGELLTNRLELGDLWYGQGFSTNDPIGMQGHRAPGGVLFAVDEASGVANEVFRVGAGYGTVGNSKTIIQGNLNASSGYFFNCFDDLGGKFGHLWKSFRISAFDVPLEFNGQPLMDPEWIKRAEAAAGNDPESDPTYRVQVLALPPLSDESALYPRSLLEQCQDLQPETLGTTMGVDVAWMGWDSCVAVLNDRGRVKAFHKWQHARYHESAEIVMQLKEKWGIQRWVDVKVEQDGIGSGLIDDLYRRGHRVESVVVGGGALGDWNHITGEPRVRNRRNELHYVAWRLLQQGGLAIPAHYEEAWSDLSQIRKVEDPAGYFAVEPKKAFKARVGRSPDYADAIMCSLARSATTFSAAVGGTRGRR